MPFSKHQIFPRVGQLIYLCNYNISHYYFIICSVDHIDGSDCAVSISPLTAIYIIYIMLRVIMSKLEVKRRVASGLMIC